MIRQSNLKKKSPECCEIQGKGNLLLDEGMMTALSQSWKGSSGREIKQEPKIWRRNNMENRK